MDDSGFRPKKQPTSSKSGAVNVSGFVSLYNIIWWFFVLIPYQVFLELNALFMFYRTLEIWFASADISLSLNPVLSVLIIN